MQHRFAEARAVVDRMGDAEATFNTSDLQTRLLRVEIYTEIGDYTAAEKALRANAPKTEDKFAKAVRARLPGDQRAARAGAGPLAAGSRRDRSCLRDAASEPRLVRDARGRFAGRDGPRRRCRALLSRRARHLPARLPRADRTDPPVCRGNDWNATITWGQKAADMVPNPEVIGLLGDAYRARGNAVQAQEEYHSSSRRWRFWPARRASSMTGSAPCLTPTMTGIWTRRCAWQNTN